MNPVEDLFLNACPECGSVRVQGVGGVRSFPRWYCHSCRATLEMNGKTFKVYVVDGNSVPGSSQKQEAP